MFTAFLLLLSQCPNGQCFIGPVFANPIGVRIPVAYVPGGCCNPHRYIYPYCGPMFVPLYSPWNAAVAELRVKRAQQPPARPTALEWSSLETLAAEVAAAKRLMIEADQDEKADCRKEYYALRHELEDARLKVARDMHRRRRNNTEF
jgi:hypothetical protein